MSVKALTQQMEQRRGELDLLTQHWIGETPASFLSKDSRDAMESKLGRLGVNMPRLVIQSVVERMKLQGFKEPSADGPDAVLSRVGRRVNLGAVADAVHNSRALYGAGFLTVWTSAAGKVIVIPETPLTAAVRTDPATGEVLEGMRTWTAEGWTYAAHFTAERVTRWKSKGEMIGAQWEPDGTGTDNGLGVVPMVPFIRSNGIDDKANGTSLVADILDLTNALAKVLADGMVTSEYFAKPRRWATGLEIVEDEDGTPIDPFGKKRFLQSEAPETKFGQLQGTGPDAYTTLVATLTQQIGALSGLPPHYLGLHGDQPASAEGVRAAEAQLVARVMSEIAHTENAWSQVAALMAGIENGTDPLSLDYVPIWGSPETRTPAQAADSAAKLAGIGVPLRSLLREPLGYEPPRIAEIMGDVAPPAPTAAPTPTPGPKPGPPKLVKAPAPIKTTRK